MAVHEPVKDRVDLGLDIGGKHDILVHRGNWGALRGNLNARRPKQKLICQPLHSLRKGGTEQHILSFVWQHFEQVAQLWHESHVHHAVRFVQDEGTELLGHQGATEIEFHESARGRHHHIGTGFEFGDLGFGSHATDQSERTNVCVGCKPLHRRMHLQGEFFGWNQDGNPGMAILPSLQVLQKGKDVCPCFSRACLGDANDILPSQQPWNGLHLNRRGHDVPQIGDRTQKLSLQLQVLELHPSKVGGKLSCGMMERWEDSPFEDMAPYSGNRAEQALKTLLEARDWATDLARMVPSHLASQLVEQWKSVESIGAFQDSVVKPFIQGLMAQTTDAVTWQGNPQSFQEGMLFLSNHRDIVLDPSLLNVALLEEGRGSTEIGIGSNLLSKPWVNDLVRLNRCFVVERSGSARERYEHSLRTAAYIQHVTRQSTPVWLAHREGRAKDGRDTTAPALMRTLSNNGDAEVWDALRVVPVSISYEWDPCDAMKVNELLHLEVNGEYIKSPGEDERSMWTGLMGQKGRVHLEFGDLLSWQPSDEPKPERAMAKALDQSLHRGMKVWPNQRLAAEHLGLERELFAHIPEPQKEDKDLWTSRKDRVEEEVGAMGWSKEQIAQTWCGMLAAPLALRKTLLAEG